MAQVAVTISVHEVDDDGEMCGAQAVTREFSSRRHAAEWIERVAHHDVRDGAITVDEWEVIDELGGF